MNHMKEIAQILDVELNEEFKIEGYVDHLRYKLTEENLECFTNDKQYAVHTVPATLVRLLNGQCKLIKLPKPILNDVERKYLTGIIRPFKDKVESIYKYRGNYNSVESIIICVRNENSIMLPNFKTGTMYQNMEPQRKYSLEELEL